MLEHRLRELAPAKVVLVGAVILGILVAALGYAASFVTESQFGARVLKGVGISLIILAVVTGTNVLNDIATALGITGIDFTCSGS